MDRRTVLITGVAGRWGRRLARQLVTMPTLRVLGLDIRQPARPIDGVEYIQADLRNPLLVELLRKESVEGVFHLVFTSGLKLDGQKLSAEEAFQINVMGTMEVLAAAQAAEVKQVVLKSTTMLYGAQYSNPLYLNENHRLYGRSGKPLLSQRYEIEKFVDEFRRKHNLQIAVLRYPSIMGKSGASSLMRYLAQPAPPTLLGFDPAMQVVHESDVIGSMLHAMATEANGVFNVAADGIMPLIQLIRQVGRQPIPLFHPFAYGLRRLPFVKNNSLINKIVPFELDYLRYQWVADTQRMRTELGYEPQYTIEEAVKEFHESLRMQRYSDVIPQPAKANSLRTFIERTDSAE